MKVNKQALLDNVEEYPVEQLVKFILAGIVTYDELVKDTQGQFDAKKRKEVQYLLKNGDSDEWTRVKKERTLDAIQHYLDTFPNGDFRAEARSLKAEVQQEVENKEKASSVDHAWTLVDKSNVKALQTFINQHSGNQYVSEAKTLVNNLQLAAILGLGVDTLISQIRQYQTNRSLTPAQKDNNIIDVIVRYLLDKKISKNDFLGIIQQDNNLLSAGVLKRLLKDGVISFAELTDIDIDKLFIQKMYNGESAQTFPTVQKLEKIHKQSTEIYFWGIPSSGKSCALGAILSVAANGRVAKSMDPDTQSQGYGYMTKLINLFQDGEVGTLIEGTPIDSFYEMGFDLVDNEGKVHPITCIDMAGELMRCMYKENAGDLMTDKEEEMLDTLTKVLIDNRSTSRKMHVFVIEYGAEDRLYEGLPQKVFLDGAASYIKNTGIFKKETDAIFIMISKADKAKGSSKEALNQYINDKYLGFFNNLERICIDNEINKGRVEKIAFTLGEVCFQSYCRFDPRAAENMVNVILQRSASNRGGKLGMFQKIFRS